jgi:hypothetical protein
MQAGFEEFTIWHLGEVGDHIFNIKRKAEEMRDKSQMHTPEFIDWWYKSMMIGSYPVKIINLDELPKIIKDKFGIKSGRWI